MKRTSLSAPDSCESTRVASGVKPVERRAPPKAAAGVKPRVAPRREHASGRPAASPAGAAGAPAARGERPAGGGRAALYVLLTLVVLGGAAAALYYTGVLGKLLG